MQRRTAPRARVGMLGLAIALAGCATASRDITSTYVSPLQYQSYDCQQMEYEKQRVQRRVLELGGRLDEAAANDKTLTGVGVVLFWPALFALGGTKQQEAEYARLKGEYEAIEQAAVQRGCGSPGSPAPAVASTAISSGAGVVTPVPAGDAAPAAAPAPTFARGDRLVYLARDPISGVEAGETVLSVDSLDEREWTFNEGAVVVARNGQPVRGMFHPMVVYGLPAAPQRVPSWRAKVRVAGSSAEVPAEVRLVGMETRVVSGRTLQAARLHFEGYSSREAVGGLASYAGSAFSGELLVDADSGLLLWIHSRSRNAAYALQRELVRIVH